MCILFPESGVVNWGNISEQSMICSALISYYDLGQVLKNLIKLSFSHLLKGPLIYKLED